MILSDLWLGGLRSRRWTNIKVILSLIFPPAILKLEFKSKEELQLMPQTEEEHLVGIKEGQSADLNSSSSSTESYQSKGHVTGDKYGVQVNGTLNEYESNEFVDSPRQKKGQQQLNFRKKIYEFYAAPVTTFWGHSMAHVAFLLIYTYTLLIKLPEVPAWNEYYVMAYIATFGCEKVREVMASEPIRLRQKLYVWLHDWWNFCDTVMTLEFFLGVALRIDGHLIDYARVFYCLNIIYWYSL
jgi:transient receptor potential cation channel subfamily M member 3